MVSRLQSQGDPGLRSWARRVRGCPGTPPRFVRPVLALGTPLSEELAAWLRAELVWETGLLVLWGCGCRLLRAHGWGSPGPRPSDPMPVPKAEQVARLPGSNPVWTVCSVSVTEKNHPRSGRLQDTPPSQLLGVLPSLWFEGEGAPPPPPRCSQDTSRGSSPGQPPLSGVWPVGGVWAPWGSCAMSHPGKAVSVAAFCHLP